jgi:hypothetical protein
MTTLWINDACWCVLETDQKLEKKGKKFTTTNCKGGPL